MKNLVLYSLKNVLSDLIEKGAGSIKFRYFLVKNLGKIEAEIANLEKSKRPTEAFDKYAQEAKEVAESFYEKDKDGNLILYSEPGGKGDVVEGRGYPKILNKEKLESALKALEDANREHIDEYNSVVEEFNSMVLQEESSISFYLINVSEIPEFVSTQQLAVLEPLIKPE